MYERLWAGWRMKYIASAKTKGCLFCEKAAETPSPKNLVLTVTPLSLIMLNAFPYNCGHLMVAPRRHVSSFTGLTEGESLELVGLVGLCERLLKRVYRAEGLNIGLNLGKSAGAGVLGHLHVHVVPRWVGDTNFMATVSATKVLPESLGDSYRRLKAGLRELTRAQGGNGTRRTASRAGGRAVPQHGKTHAKKGKRVR